MEQLVKVTRGGQVTIPAEMRQRMGIEIGDYVEIRHEEGHLVLIPKQLIDKDQTWFWSKEWQDAEREAEDDLHTGRVEGFDTLDALIADLDGDTEE